MEVELREVFGTHLATRKRVKLPQYRVYVDGKMCGIMGFATGSPICFMGPVGPVEAKQIESRVKELVGWEVNSSSPPDVPPELLNTTEEDGQDFDDFDT